MQGCNTPFVPTLNRRYKLQQLSISQASVD